MVLHLRCCSDSRSGYSSQLQQRQHGLVDGMLLGAQVLVLSRSAVATPRLWHFPSLGLWWLFCSLVYRLFVAGPSVTRRMYRAGAMDPQLRSLVATVIQQHLSEPG